MFPKTRLIAICLLSLAILANAKITQSNSTPEDSLPQIKSKEQISYHNIYQKKQNLEQQPTFSNMEQQQLASEKQSQNKKNGNKIIIKQNEEKNQHLKTRQKDVFFKKNKKSQGLKFIKKRMLNEQQLRILGQQTTKDENQSQNKPKRQVFDCIMYNGENHLLSLRLQIMDSFVDYFVISEGRFTFTGQKKDLVFDITIFPKYSHKILYQAVDKFPKTGNIKSSEQWENYHYGRDAAIKILNENAKDRDIVLISDVDQILSKQGFQQFDPQMYPWVATEMRQFYYYFNRMSVFDNKGKEEIPHIWTFGTKITTIQVLRQRFENKLGKLKRGYGCSDKIDQIINYDPMLTCQYPILRKAGWHFSYVLDDVHLLGKLTSFADGNINTKVANYTAQRTVSPAPLMYLQDFEVEDADIPIELRRDMVLNKQNSIYYPYFVKVVPNVGCQDDEVEKLTGKRKIKTRIVINQRDGPNEYRANKTVMPTQCVQVPIRVQQDQNEKKKFVLQKEIESNQEKNDEDSKSQKILTYQFLKLNFYVQIIVIVIWIFWKQQQSKEKEEQLKETKENYSNSILNSDRQGIQNEQPSIISL